MGRTDRVHSVSPLYLSQAEVVRAGLTLAEVIAIVEETLRLKAEGQVACPPKIPLHPRPGAFFHAMPACVPSRGAVGIKWVGYFPGNLEARGVPDSAGILVLSSLETGQPECIMDGMWLSYARTAAATAVAAKYLARRDARTLGLVGAGGLGRSCLRALREVCPRLERVLVFARRDSSRREFCDEMAKEFAGALVPVTSAQAAVAEAEIVVSSTSQPQTPFLEAAWVGSGALIAPLEAIAAWETEVLRVVHKFVVDDTGQAMERVRTQRPGEAIPEPYAELGDIVVGRRPGRETEAERIFALNSGYAATDVTVGRAVYLRALAMGLGTRLALY